MPLKVLIIEDEMELNRSIASYLKDEAYSCETAGDYRTAINKLDLFDYDCILLDITLPDGNGLDILNQLKLRNRLDGILIISAKNAIEDRVEGLKLGADDYLAKPFHLSELSARIASIIRRRNFSGSNSIDFNEIKIDTAGRQVYVNDNAVELTRKEYEILLYFITNKRKVISKNALADHLWGYDSYGNIDFIYTHIKNLRKKMHDAGSTDYLKSVYGIGYKFTDR